KNTNSRLWIFVRLTFRLTDGTRSNPQSAEETNQNDARTNFSLRYSQSRPKLPRAHEGTHPSDRRSGRAKITTTHLGNHGRYYPNARYPLSRTNTPTVRPWRHESESPEEIRPRVLSLKHL